MSTITIKNGHLHSPGQEGGVVDGLLLILEPEYHVGQLLALLVDPLLGALPPQHLNVLEHHQQDVVHMFYREIDINIACSINILEHRQ